MRVFSSYISGSNIISYACGLVKGCAHYLRCYTALTAETDIPHFKEVIIMATTCDYCGWKTNEVKSGAGISETGVRISLKLTDPSDLNREILKVIMP